jgi:hypothetical protein
VKIKKFNESINNKDVNSLKQEFKDMFQEIEDDGISLKVQILLVDGQFDKDLKDRLIFSNYLFSVKNLLERSNNIYSAFRYEFRYDENGWYKADKHPIKEILNIIDIKEKNYDNYDFYVSISNKLVELFILTDIPLMTKENFNKFEPLFDKGLDTSTATISSPNSIEIGLFSGQLKGTILNLRGGNEIENPGLKRFFNDNYILDQNIIRLK